MMKAKLLEIRDEGTFIPFLCVDMNPGGIYPQPTPTSMAADDFKELVHAHGNRLYLLRRCGYPCDDKPNIAITRLSADGDKCANDPFYWNDRTRYVAHTYIIEHWNELKDGDVVDVQFILGETKEPKVSERIEAIQARNA